METGKIVLYQYESIVLPERYVITRIQQDGIAFLAIYREGDISLDVEFVAAIEECIPASMNNALPHSVEEKYFVKNSDNALEWNYAANPFKSTKLLRSKVFQMEDDRRINECYKRTHSDYVLSLKEDDDLDHIIFVRTLVEKCFSDNKAEIRIPRGSEGILIHSVQGYSLIEFVESSLSTTPTAFYYEDKNIEIIQ